MSVRVTDKDQGYRKTLKLLTSGKKPVIQVGIFGDAAAAMHGELSVGEIATIHEFGLGTCPERSFIRGWVDGNEDKVVQFTKKQMEKCVSDHSDNFDIVYERIGMYCVGGIQKRISDGIPPALKPATINRKGSSTPLINTGQLRSSVTYKVNPEGVK